MNAQHRDAAPANADALHHELISLLSRFEFVRAELAQLRGLDQQGPALTILLQMIDHLAELAEKHVGPGTADQALGAAAELYNEVEQFRQRHTRSGRFSLAGLFEAGAARAERQAQRRDEYLRVAELAIATIEQFLKLFTPLFPPGTDDWAQAYEVFLADLRQTLAAFQK
jgi:hypothetical protein